MKRELGAQQIADSSPGIPWMLRRDGPGRESAAQLHPQLDKPAQAHTQTRDSFQKQARRLPLSSFLQPEEGAQCPTYLPYQSSQNVSVQTSVEMAKTIQAPLLIILLSAN